MIDSQRTPIASKSRLAPVGKGGFRDRLYVVIFEHDTKAGQYFDIALLLAILGSMLAVMLESVRSIRESYGGALTATEWVFTTLFAFEYLLRLYSVNRPFRYATSFFGGIDLLSILPAFVAWVVPGTHTLSVVRALRLLRVFRILKLARFVREADTLLAALRASRVKIAVFLGFILTFVSILASLMYLVEGESAGFTSIPRAMYWAIVTMTTVGYGDIAPKTVVGQIIAAMVMILGYSIIAVPTGIVSVNMKNTEPGSRSDRPDSDQRPSPGTETQEQVCEYCGRAFER